MKAAWSEPAAVNLWPQGRLLQALREVVAEMEPGGIATLGTDLARMLATLHSPRTHATVAASGIELPLASEWSQSSPDRLRNDLLPRLDPPRRAHLASVIDRVQEVLERRPEDRSFVHGDFHAYPNPLDRDRIFAWYLLTDLGDALWRTVAGVAVEFGPIEARVDGALRRLRSGGVDWRGL